MGCTEREGIEDRGAVEREGSEDRGAVVREGGSKGSERGNVGGWGNGEI